MHKYITPLLASILCASTMAAAELTASDLDKRRKALNDLLTEQWEYVLRTNPEYASILGDKRFNDKASDISMAAIQRDLAASRRFLRSFEAIGTIGFSDQEKVNKALMVKNLRDGIEDTQLKEYEMPVNQMGGWHLFAAQLPALLTFNTTKDYDDYVARLRALPTQIDGTIDFMRRGMNDRLMPPKFLLGKVAGQAQSIADQDPEKSPFAEPLGKFPDSVSESDRTRIRAAFLDAIRNQVFPAYQKFAKFVSDEYAPRGNPEVGMWSLPDGAHRYQVRINRGTTTNMNADQIHQIGLAEVTRLEGEMMQIAKKANKIDVPIVVVSAVSQQALTRLDLDIVKLVITKPFDVDEFTKAILEICRERQAAK